MDEAQILVRLRRIARHEAARDLLDDAALLDGFVVTHDSIAEDIHYLAFDPPATVGWKLVAANLSDLAAKGAVPAGALLSLTMTGDGRWEDEFLNGLEAACESYGLPLIGGDTIALRPNAPRVLGMTVLGRPGPHVPSRGGALPGDALWLVGSIGDSAAGLAQLRLDRRASGPLVDIYRRPVPLLADGQTLAPHAHAMMDVSDGLLLDAGRMAEASGCRAVIDLDAVQLSVAFKRERGDTEASRLFAATGGDDYALIAALPPELLPETLSLPSGTRIARIGSLEAGRPGLVLTSRGRPLQLPERLGHEHRSNPSPDMADRP